MDGPWRESPTFHDCKEAALELIAAAWLGTGEAQGQVGSHPRARTGGATRETSTLPKHQSVSGCRILLSRPSWPKARDCLVV